MLELLKNDTKRITHIPYETRHRIRQLAYFRMIHGSDLVCRQSTRMDRRCFAILCHLLRTIAGLTSTEVVDVEEMVAMFLNILAHDVKNRVIQREFMRLGETISRHFNMVLLAVIRLHQELLKKPQPVPNDCTDQRWRWFENCLGALDGTYIKVNVPVSDRARYRTRKGEVATNVLGVCDTKGDFIYVLAGWEGSAADSRILRDALSRPNGLKVPKGYYYLVDVGYPNAEGFLAPYRGQRYHLQEWRGPENAPSTSKKFFNMKHSSARVQCRTILACCLLHNLINREMTNFGIEDNIDEVDSTHATTAADDIHYIQTSNEWSQWRDDLVEEMFTEWEFRNQ
ncbi:retrotransposon protein [Cucumis melo var. makuwa]|uniref:Retrotransposon protein n=1 Tax=Cucumis melo var. makuwa TaxID=1194695 RepID=A0A5D3CKE3_CUCMM|nr:retrotransposon protein [Cucumis melo var. makuwa]TYK12383.1 retrotransposon protein [Cucumis melo var. makuwa]